jgi:hypothetical protein
MRNTNSVRHLFPNSILSEWYLAEGLGRIALNSRFVNCLGHEGSLINTGGALLVLLTLAQMSNQSTQVFFSHVFYRVVEFWLKVT